ncbi:unnamed protein product [Heterotrigona itama]|uniref:Uncharacterized protein n=1 Tax=Heterotrigona itama TaxID=395501 RepID=A0A6V7GUD1_9HYME|nr:unnamed protein product [Heterotrigona itama]
MGSVFAHKDDSLNRKTPPPPPHSRDLRSNFGLTKRRFSTVSRRNTSHRRFTIPDPGKSSIVFQRRNYTVAVYYTCWNSLQPLTFYVTFHYLYQSVKLNVGKAILLSTRCSSKKHNLLRASALTS